MINKILSPLISFLLSLVTLPMQQVQVIKHKSAPLAFVSPAIETFDNSSGLVIATTAATVPAGSFVFVICRTGSGSVTSQVVTSVPVATWTQKGQSQASLGTIQPSYTFGYTGGSSTFTCTANGAGAFRAIEVLVFTPGFLTTFDTNNTQNGSVNSNLPTSGLITTTAKGLVLMCQTNSDSPTITAGTVGVTSTIYPGTNVNMGCEYGFPSAAQVNVAGTVSFGTAQDWITNIVAFK